MFSWCSTLGAHRPHLLRLSVCPRSTGLPKGVFVQLYRLARALDEAQIDAVSIEDAHRPNDLRLLEEFTVTKVLLGVVKIASSKVESAEDITMRLKRATEHIDRHRLEAAPDCGLGYLGRDLARQKLACMCACACQVTTMTSVLTLERIVARPAAVPIKASTLGHGEIPALLVLLDLHAREGIVGRSYLRLRLGVTSHCAGMQSPRRWQTVRLRPNPQRRLPHDFG